MPSPKRFERCWTGASLAGFSRARTSILKVVLDFALPCRRGITLYVPGAVDNRTHYGSLWGTRGGIKTALDPPGLPMDEWVSWLVWGEGCAANLDCSVVEAIYYLSAWGCALGSLRSREPSRVAPTTRQFGITIVWHTVCQEVSFEDNPTVCTIMRGGDTVLGVARQDHYVRSQ